MMLATVEPGAGMSVTIDSEPLPVEAMGLKTIGDVLAHVQTQNRLVTQVLIDGEPPDLTGVAQLRQRSLQGHVVYIETTEPREIALQVLAAIDAQMTDAEAGRLAAIEHLGAGEPNEALKKLSGCFTAWQTAQEAISKVSQLLRVDLDRVIVEGVSLNTALQNFAEQLRSIRQALESRDYVTLSDVLHYEIGTTVRQWRDALTQLRAIVA